jgi:hypothetical protein
MINAVAPEAPWERVIPGDPASVEGADRRNRLAAVRASTVQAGDLPI